eukprot:TRINITY_DN14586_c0_g1_i1.p1 TRINITY_DN14586_c0_g1~~TRINITY_DN14586_c0_g1_i1.p1  ORF type:complete len:389 (+),score=40.57 TRINITY_DN14586_c0_g1_i1:54-1169(+)
MQFFEFQEVSAIQWAYEFGAMYISIEHRYYGDSNPTADYSTPNMRFLSSQQALADAAYFIEQYNATIQSGPWVVFGCSYSGALSAWFRLKYPHLVIASVAPSGPVFAQANYTGYYQQFGKVAPTSCINAVRNGSAQVMSMLQTPSGRSQLATLFQSCQPLSANMPDNWFFLRYLMETVGGADQFENPPAWPLNATCQTLTTGTNILENWAQLVIANSSDCIDYTLEGFLIPMQNTTNQDRSWYFQKCTEFGFFKPCYPDTGCVFDNFNLDVDPLYASCSEVFGIPNMAPHISFTNDYYGGYNLVSSNTMFTNGLFDPWHLLSINENLPSGVQAVTYEAGHCAPMTAPDPQDPPSLTAARAAVKSFLSSILA